MEELLLKGELLCKLRTIYDVYNKYECQEFATIGAKHLSKIIKDIVKLIINRLEIYTTNQIKLIKTSLIPDIEVICGYLSQSIIKYVPWNILPAFEKLFKNLFESAEFIICASWEKSYAIINTNILTILKTQVIDVPNLLFDIDSTDDFTIQVEKFLSRYPKEIYLIFFPKYERLSALHFSLLGHEIGHISAKKWITIKINDFFNTTQLLEKTKEILENDNSDVPELFREVVIKEAINRIQGYIVKILNELISDIFGILLFGETTLFSTFLFSQGFVMDDTTNWQKGYLSWRFRIINILESMIYIKKKFNYKLVDEEKYNAIIEIIQQKQIKDIEINSYIKHFITVYYDHRNDIIEYLINEINNNIFTNFINNEVIQKAIDRLSILVPPNSYYEDNTLFEKPIDFRNILYATWIKILNDLPDTAIEYEEKTKQINLLSIKAIEFSIEQERYNDIKQS